jgi:hypothetical protein
MATQGCGDDGKGACVETDPVKIAKNAQHLAKLNKDAYKNKCSGGNKSYCDGNPVEIAAFTLTGMIGVSAAGEFVLGGGVASATEAVPGLAYKAAKGAMTACLMNSVCQQLLPKTYDPRVEAQTDAFHNFPRLLDPIIMKAGDKTINGPFINYAIEGSVEVAGEVTTGVFEIGVKIVEWSPIIVHHFFNPG